MNTQDVEDVLNVSGILSDHSLSDAAHTPSLIADLIEWRDRSAVNVSLSINPNEPSSATATPKNKRKAKAETPDDTFEASPDPSADEPDF